MLWTSPTTFRSAVILLQGYKTDQELSRLFNVNIREIERWSAGMEVPHYTIQSYVVHCAHRLGVIEDMTQALTRALSSLLAALLGLPLITITGQWFLGSIAILCLLSNILLTWRKYEDLYHRFEDIQLRRREEENQVLKFVDIPIAVFHIRT